MLYPSISDIQNALNKTVDKKECYTVMKDDDGELFAVQANITLESGTEAGIHPAFKIIINHDAPEFKLDIEHPFVAKIKKSSGVTSVALVNGTRVSREVALSRSIYYQASSGTLLGLPTMFVPRQPGTDLYNFITQLRRDRHTDDAFTFSDRVSLVLSIVLAYQNIHQKGIIHIDVKPENMMWDNEKKTLSLVDFNGSAVLPRNKDSITLAPGKIIFSASSVAPETLCENTVSIRSDIYALVYAIALIFGANNPAYLKDEIPFNIYRYIPQTHPADYSDYPPYDFSGIFTGVKEIPKYSDHDLCKKTIEFLARMSNPDPKQRPDTSDTLRFFTALRQYVLTYHSPSLSPPDKEERLPRYYRELETLSNPPAEHLSPSARC
jgi:serine/threonine protein kinase